MRRAIDRYWTTFIGMSCHKGVVDDEFVLNNHTNAPFGCELIRASLPHHHVITYCGGKSMRSHSDRRCRGKRIAFKRGGQLCLLILNGFAIVGHWVRWTRHNQYCLLPGATYSLRPAILSASGYFPDPSSPVLIRQYSIVDFACGWQN